jgi:Resolvase, N terminal domain
MSNETGLVGYARVSRSDQDPQLQIDALKRAGCAKIFVDHMTGSHMDRPQPLHSSTCAVATPWFYGRWTGPGATPVACWSWLKT